MKNPFVLSNAIIARLRSNDVKLQNRKGGEINAAVTVCYMGFALAAVVFVGFSAVSVNAVEHIGTSTADAPNLVGQFVVHNPTTATIKYSVKWGANAQWQLFELGPKHLRKHSHDLNQSNQAPKPYLRFDNIGGDGKSTYTVYHMAFGQVGYAGFGPRGNIDESIHYEFRYDPSGRFLSMVRR